MHFVVVIFLVVSLSADGIKIAARILLCSGGVHYRDKETVSWRLSLSGLAVAYNETVSRYRGPYPVLLKLDSRSHTVTVEYDDGRTSLVVRTTEGFEVNSILQTIYKLSV